MLAPPAELFGGHIILILVSWSMAQLLLPPGAQPRSAARPAAAAWECLPRAAACALNVLMACPSARLPGCAGLGPLSALQLAAAVSTACQLPLLFVDLRRLSRLAMVGCWGRGKAALPACAYWLCLGTQCNRATCQDGLKGRGATRMLPLLPPPLQVGLASSGFLVAMVLSLLALDPHRQAMPQQVRRWMAATAKSASAWPALVLLGVPPLRLG